METLFETAIRSKFRFETERGSVSTEDLWDMPLQSRDGFNLDILAVSLSNQLEEVKSFVAPRKSEDTETKNKLDIVVHVIETKLKEADAKDLASVNKEKRERILSIMKSKQDEQLMNLSEDELKEELGKL